MMHQLINSTDLYHLLGTIGAIKWLHLIILCIKSNLHKIWNLSSLGILWCELWTPNLGCLIPNLIKVFSSDSVTWGQILSGMTLMVNNRVAQLFLFSKRWTFYSWVSSRYFGVSGRIQTARNWKPVFLCNTHFYL